MNQTPLEKSLGVRADGQKVLLAIKGMGGESTEAWRAVLDDLIQRGLRRPEFLIVDGAPRPIKMGTTASRWRYDDPRQAARLVANFVYTFCICYGNELSFCAGGISLLCGSSQAR